MIVNLGLLTGLSMKELVTLAGHGFGMGAMKLARTVMENTINAEYLRQYPTEFELYLNWHWVEQHKLLTYVRENIPHLLASISTEAMETIDKEFAAVRVSYTNRNGDIRNSWCASNLAQRAAKTVFAETCRLINPLSSAFIHGTFGGLSRHFDLSKDEDRISIEPSLKYCQEALSGGHWCLCAMVATLAQTFNSEPVHSVERLKEDFHYAWPMSKPPDDSAAATAN
jgi:hypothetical protein